MIPRQKERKVIVTGGAGFIGSHLVSRLVKLKFQVIVIDNFSTGKIQNIKEIKSNIKIIKADISNFENLQKHFAKEQGVDYIFHLAALPRIERANDNPEETHRANVDGVFNILELARLLQVKKIIFTSSSSVYGAQKKQPLKEDATPFPQNLYAMQKLIGEKYCDIYSRVFNIPVLTLRLFNVYGTHMKGEGAYQLVFTKWFEQMDQGQPLTIYGDGKQTRDFTYVSDVVNALIKAARYKQKSPHEIINIGSGRQVSVKYLSQLFGHKVIHVEPRKFEERFKQADIRKAKRLLVWLPKTTIEKGVQELMKEYQPR